MKEYTVRILDTVFADINDIADFIVQVSTVEHAIRYVRELHAEIMTLRYLAGIIPESRYRSVRHYFFIIIAFIFSLQSYTKT